MFDRNPAEAPFVPCAPDRCRADDSAALRRALDYIAHCYAQRITLADLAALTAKTPFALIRLFRRELRTTPHACIVDVRLAAALRLLEAGAPIAAVAAETGFADQGHLTRQFKRAHGIPPRRYLAAARGARTELSITPPGAGAGRSSAAPC